MLRRILAAAIVMAALGALLNVLVAWTCAASGKTRMMDARRLGQLRAAEYEREERMQAAGQSVAAGRYIAGLYVGIGSCVIGIKNDPTQIGWSEEHQAGWPWLSMRATRETAPEGGVRIGGVKLVYPSAGSSSMQTGPSIMTDRLLPLMPMWPGFAFNTIVYALVAWLMWLMLVMTMRIQRSLRGLCSHCAYPVGTSPVCTECGRKL